jgi:hypothetical protein
MKILRPSICVDDWEAIVVCENCGAKLELQFEDIKGYPEKWEHEPFPPRNRYRDEQGFSLMRPEKLSFTCPCCKGFCDYKNMGVNTIPSTVKRAIFCNTKDQDQKIMGL